MAKTVILTPHAYHDLKNISSYLFEKWGFKVLENFLALYEAKIVLITEYPTRYPGIHHPTVAQSSTE